MAQNLFDLTGKTALITGARKGIGLAMARILAENGADLIVVSSKQASDDELTRYVKGLGRKITVILQKEWLSGAMERLFLQHRCGVILVARM